MRTWSSRTSRRGGSTSTDFRFASSPAREVPPPTSGRRLNSLNYGDLLNLTARVLRENVGVRRALQQKYQYLLVDEFQDTDPVQAEIVFWLAEDSNVASTSKKASPPDWRQVPLRPGALFVVGDPKQSIYRFRRADIDIYNIVRGRFSEKGVGVVLPLTMNFRSGPDLCTWANTVFETCFPKKPTAHAPQFAPLDPKPKQAVRGKVCTLTHHCDKDELMERDAERIAAFIRTEVDAGRRRYSDFLILTRKKKNRIAPYAAALEALNIPAEVSGAGAFGESRDVEALTKLLRALADPQDAVALVAVLRGPLFGISDPELFAFKQSGGWFSIFQSDAEGPSGRPTASVSRSGIALNHYYRWTRVLPAAGALERILEASGYLALAATTPGGVDAGDVLHAVDRVRQVVETGGSLADAADALEADREATSEVESLPLEPGRADVVRLMNLHKAKGLEANVVFLADPAGGVKPRVDVHIERDGLQARGWLKIVRKSDNVLAGTAARAACGLGHARTSRTALCRSGGGPPALCGGHSRARNARGEPVGGQAGRRRVGQAQCVSRKGARAVRACQRVSAGFKAARLHYGCADRSRGASRPGARPCEPIVLGHYIGHGGGATHCADDPFGRCRG